LKSWLDQIWKNSKSTSSSLAIFNCEGKKLWCISDGPTNEFTIAFSHDGTRVAILGDDTLRIWDLPLRRPWLQILTLAAFPPAALAVLLVACRLRGPSRSPLHGAV
jgi:WD40 repeat protein